MSISIYYTAKRPASLSAEEQDQIAQVLLAHSVEELIRQRQETEIGHNWESFCVYDLDDPTEHDVIFEGATRLPDNSAEACWEGLQHWCAALTALRLVLPNAQWSVHVDDHEIAWDESQHCYDPSQ